MDDWPGTKTTQSRYYSWEYEEQTMNTIERIGAQLRARRIVQGLSWQKRALCGLVRTAVVAALGVMLLAVPICAAQARGPRVAFKDDMLLVDGKPFFFIGSDGVPTTLEDFKAHHFNTVFSWGRRAVDTAPEAAKLGLFVMPFVQSTRKRAVEQCKEVIARLKDADNVLAFNVGDDLGRAHVAQVQACVDALRAAAPGLPIAYDCIGASQDAYAKVGDMFGTYTYILDRTPPGTTYLGWMEQHCEPLRDNQYRWTWVQSHSQWWYTSEFFCGPSRTHIASPYPDGETIRWLTYQAVAAGCKGILYYHNRFFADKWLGKDRWAEVGIINAELETLGPHLAASRRGPEVSCDREDVVVRSRLFDRGMIVVAVKTAPTYNHQLDEAFVLRARVSVKGAFAPGARALLVGFPAARELPVSTADGAVHVELTNLEIAAPILISADAALLAEVKRRTDGLAPEIAGRAVTAAEGKLSKVRNVLSQIRKLEGHVPEADAALAQATALVADARAADDPTETINLARKARRGLRQLQQEIWARFRDDPEANSDGRVLDFYLVPQGLEKVVMFKQAEGLPNCLANPSFEQGEKRPAAWSAPPPKIGKGRGFGERCGNNPRTGKHCIHFAGRDLVPWHGRKYDWVTAQMTSTPVPVAEGECVVVEVWAHVPAVIKHTNRGAILNLLGFDSDGKAVPGLTPQAREASVFQATDEWRRLRLSARVPKRVVKVQVRIGITGIGECFFDDARLVHWRPRP